ncbi:hypothetical protein J6590_058047 [Homalodisca vitripennis]|nr:hypothetical protein J6590_058047 [Homalodisca vitripennis]
MTRRKSVFKKRKNVAVQKHKPESDQQVGADLADPALLKKCILGKSKNPNESVNAVIWSRLPKTVFVGLQTLECLVLKELGMSVSKNTASVMSELDRLRVQRGERELSKLQKKARQRCENAKRRLEEAFAEEEDLHQP